jgi:uncharacterized protein
MTQAFLETVTSGDRHAVQQLLAADPGLASATDAQGQSPLMLALYRGHADLARDLLAARPPESLTIHEAAAAGVLERLEAILRVDPGAVNSWAPDGFFPLALAAFFGHPAAVDLLLARGADVRAVARHPFKITALHAALASSHPESAIALVDAGADVNARQQAGFTPLHTTAMRGYLELTRMLLQHGADPSIANEQGQTPLDLARAADHASVVDLLSAARSTP